MGLKTSDIKQEAKGYIKDIFHKVTSSEDKELWLKAFNMINNHIIKQENGDRGEVMFIWKEVNKQMSNLYGKKFIKPSKIG